MLVLGASALGGYSLLTSAKDQASLLGQTTALSERVEKELSTNRKALHDLVVSAQVNLVDIQERQASLTEAYARLAAVVQESSARSP